MTWTIRVATLLVTPLNTSTFPIDRRDVEEVFSAVGM